MLNMILAIWRILRIYKNVKNNLWYEKRIILREIFQSYET